MPPKLTLGGLIQGAGLNQEINQGCKHEQLCCSVRKYRQLQSDDSLWQLGSTPHLLYLRVSNPWVISKKRFSSSTGCTFMEVLARACCLVPIFLIIAELSFCLFLCEGHPGPYVGLLGHFGGGSSRRCGRHVWEYNNPSTPGCSSSKRFQQAAGLAACALRGFYLNVLGDTQENTSTDGH